MEFLSQNEDLIIGENYTRGMLNDLIGLQKYPRDEIEKGIYKPSRYSSVLIFSTIDNKWGYFNIKKNDTLFIFSGNGAASDQNLIRHKEFFYELLLFIRINQDTGFYYFGRCSYEGDYELDNYTLPLYGLELLDTRFSQVKEIDIPGEE